MVGPYSFSATLQNSAAIIRIIREIPTYLQEPKTSEKNESELNAYAVTVINNRYSRTTSTTSRRTKGSPPVSRILRVPSWTNKDASFTSSSVVNKCGLSVSSTPSSGMQ